MAPVAEVSAVTSALAASETAIIIKEASEKAAIEVMRKSMELGKIKEGLNALERVEYQRKLHEAIMDKNHLRETFKGVPKDGKEAFVKMQEIKTDSNIKGALGEAHSEARNGMRGGVETQIRTEGNRIDNTTKLRKTAKFREIVFENGVLDTKDLVIKKGTRVATEVKNGRLNSLAQEINGGHAVSQIAAGKRIADESLLSINQGCLQEMLRNPVKSENIIKRIQEAGGRLIVDLPDYETQMNNAIEILKV